VTFHRALERDDLPALAALDDAYAARCGIEPLLTAAAASFFARTGHALVAVRGDAVVGFVLAQAIWGGTRPTLFTPRIVGPDDVRADLLAALVKSAYDAAVMDLTIDVPDADPALAALLSQSGWVARPLRSFARVLGSRGRPLP
jgi:hypothetical protein